MSPIENRTIFTYMYEKIFQPEKNSVSKLETVKEEEPTWSSSYNACGKCQE